MDYRKNNYWLQQSDKRERLEAKLTNEQRIRKAYKAVATYIENHDSADIDIEFLRQLCHDYIRTYCPQITDEEILALTPSFQ